MQPEPPSMSSDAAALEVLPLFAPSSSTASTTQSTASVASQEEQNVGYYELSRFEKIITTYPPILESLLAQLPTQSIFDLYHTSAYLRTFFASYPLAWKTLSFRLPQPALLLASPGNETVEGSQRPSKPYALDALLRQVVLPFGTRLTSLDLCNTAVGGIALISGILQPRMDTIQHLSVRGCKNVSIKYHLVPFLEPYTKGILSRKELALKSLYAYRCRHHRRRPYLPQSLVRRDSDSEPTHQLIEICHALGIWTDTAWCPTPGGRCSRRRDYHTGRAPGTPEVWVPFDRLWRSGNRIGPTGNGRPHSHRDGRLWETTEEGHDGEPLGTDGDGKDVPAHLRKSHRIFVENIKCHDCGDEILERCENCSVRMHCMGCRKTLCASCAFNRPLPKKRARTRQDATSASASSSSSSSRESSASAKNRFWWAPGATRSPNMMAEPPSDGEESDFEDNPNVPVMPNMTNLKLNMHWCCLEPVFSGGGGIAFVGAGTAGHGADLIRAAPLPKKKEYEDPDFSSTIAYPEVHKNLKNSALYDQILGQAVDILPYLKQDSVEMQEQTCPRSLCQDCYRTFRWKVSCRGCKKPICKEHDFRALKVRRCGFREMAFERDYVLNHVEPEQFAIPAFKSPQGGQPAESSVGQAPNPNLAAISAFRSSSNNTPVSGSGSSNFALQNGHQTAVFDRCSNHLHNGRPARPRSLSSSSVPARRFTSWQDSQSYQSRAILPLPTYPNHPVQWEGCGAYFCPQVRPVGDTRLRCTAVLRECKECRVLVCQDCHTNNPRCNCSFCRAYFHCPYCSRKPHVLAQCVKEEELKAELHRLHQKRMEEQKLALEKLDVSLDGLGDFLDGNFHDSTTSGSGSGIEDSTENLGADAVVAIEDVALLNQLPHVDGAAPPAVSMSELAAPVTPTLPTTLLSDLMTPPAVHLEVSPSGSAA